MRRTKSLRNCSISEHHRKLICMQYIVICLSNSENLFAFLSQEHEERDLHCADTHCLSPTFRMLFSINYSSFSISGTHPPCMFLEIHVSTFLLMCINVILHLQITHYQTVIYPKINDTWWNLILTYSIQFLHMKTSADEQSDWANWNRLSSVEACIYVRLITCIL